MFQPQISGGNKSWSHARVEATIAGEHRRIFAVELESFLVEHEHGHSGAVFRIEPDLFNFVLFRIDARSFNSRPERRTAIGQVYLENGVWNGEGVECKECFFAIPLAGQSEDGTDRKQTDVTEWLSIAIEKAEQ